MKDQFFGTYFKRGLQIIALLYIFSFIGYFVGFGEVLLVAVGLTVLLVTLTKIEFGLFAAFLELFSNPHGLLLSADIFGFTLSLRMVIFLAVLVGWGIQILQHRESVILRHTLLYPFLPLFFAVITGFIVGFLRNDFLTAFSDGNAYFFLFYIFPILSVSWTSEKRRELLQLLTAGALWNVIVSFLTLYVFTHFGESVLQMSYSYLRDLRIAEVTNLATNIYRVFQQTQFFVIVFLLLVLSFVFQQKKISVASFITIALGLSILVLSLSRSFWLGFLGALVIFYFLCLTKGQVSIPQVAKKTFQLALAGVFSLVLVFLIVIFPFPQEGASSLDLTDAFSKRAAQTHDVAISSRWKLLDPMMQSIFRHPIEGSGFGSVISFVSDDPRIREIIPSGEWDTYAMEWGWLEIWLKMGILAPVSFLFLFFIYTKYFLSERAEHSWIAIGFIASLAFLALTHFFSPYLNHPIGLGFLLFCIPFLPRKTKQEVGASSLETVRIKVPQAAALAIQCDEESVAS